MNALRRSLIGAVLVILFGSPTAWCGEAVDPVARGTWILDRLKSGEVGEHRDSVLAEFEEAETELRNHLVAHSGKTADVLLLMELYLARAAFDAFKFLWTREPGLTFVSEPYGAIVDRALVADPRSPDLHYWRGYLYGVVGISDEGENPLPNARLADAIRELREAVSLKPDDERFRGCLAYQLLAAGHQSEAITFYKGIAKGSHPMYLVLHDWERVPKIEGTVSAGEDVPRFSEMLSSLLAYAPERRRMVVFPGRAADFERQCRRQWPTFRLEVSDSSLVRSGWPRKVGQRLEWVGDLLKPVPLGGKQPQWGDGGILVEVTEWEAGAKHRPRQYPGIKPDAVFCEVEFRNLRPLSPNEETLLNGDLREVPR